VEDTPAFRYIQTLEAKYPTPDWAVIYEKDAEGDDSIEIARRESGILQSVFWIAVEEVAAMEAEGADWLGDIDDILNMTDEQWEAFCASQAADDAEA
jgi:hypothetical protein